MADFISPLSKLITSLFLNTLISLAASKTIMTSDWTHLVRFVAVEDGQIHLGQIDAQEFPDVGLAVEQGKTIKAKLVYGTVFDGVVGDKSLTIAQVKD